MTQSLAGKIALVTGGAGGLGTPMTRKLAECGATVVITYRSKPKPAQDLIAALPGAGHKAVHALVDDTERLSELAKEIDADFGGLDILVNNAGTTKFVAHDDLDGLDDELIDTIFRTNWRGPFACIRAFRHLLDRGDGGLVVNVSSIAGYTAVGSNVAYCASKAGLNTMTMSLARALAPSIRVVSLSPGLVDTDFVQALDANWRATQEQTTPLKRLASPEEVGDALIAIATHLRFTTGAIIPVDGGRPLT